MTTSLKAGALPGQMRLSGRGTLPPPGGHAVPDGHPEREAGVVPVHVLTARVARTKPSATAVSCDTGAISYRSLDAWAGRIAARLTAAGVGSGSRVGVLAQPSTAMIASVLGVLKSGAAYVPVDPGHPDRQLAAVLGDVRAAAVVATRATADRAADLGLPLVLAEDEMPGPQEEGEDDDEESAHPPAADTADDPAYLIYTSGSTGEPKGVEVGHRQLAASTLARRTVYPGAAVFLLVSPLAFDSSVAGVWGTLTSGGRLVVATADEVRDPEALVGLIERHQVTQLLCVPSLYAVLLDAAERLGMQRLRSLDTVITAGEALPGELMQRHFASYERQPSLVNEYGPTEATVWASYRRYTAPGPVTIGTPVPGVRLYVLDEQLRPVPSGVDGELYIGGAQVAHGYFGQPAATARVFLDDPFDDAPGARMYRTGDLVRRRADATLDFLGRRDHQIKIRGHRVELPAVEAALGSLPGVREAVVLPDAAGTALIAFVALGVRASGADLREQLRRLLPDVMVPSRFTVLDELPRTANGKADRSELAACVEQPSRAETPVAATSGAHGTAGAVTAAWAEVLKLTDVPCDVNFFDLGGHSLAMFQLQDALEQHTGHRPAIVHLFQHTTVQAQVDLIRSGGAAAHDSGAEDRREAARRARERRARRARAAAGQEAVR